MSTATPTKRRALGVLDANVTRSPRSPSSASLPFKPTTGKGAGGGSPTKKNKASSAAAATATVVAGASAASSRHATPTPAAASVHSSVASAALETMAAQTPKKTKKRPLDAEVGTEGTPSPAVKKLCSEGDASSAAAPASASAPTPAPASAPAPAPASASPRPRSTMVEDAEEDQEPPSAWQPTTARRSISPETSELFDNSTVTNTSQLTNITEPDTEAPTAPTSARASATIPAATLPDLLPLPAPQPRRVMPTREELRQRVEILRLRLSLATYKVKTNQADVPLEELQVRPVPGMTPPRRTSPLPSMSAHTVERATPAQYWYRSSRGCGAGAGASVRMKDLMVVKREEEQEPEQASGDVAVLPALLSTPRKRTEGSAEADEVEKRLTSSGLRGGAAKGLLSLSQGS